MEEVPVVVRQGDTNGSSPRIFQLTALLRSSDGNGCVVCSYELCATVLRDAEEYTEAPFGKAEGDTLLSLYSREDEISTASTRKSLPE